MNGRSGTGTPPALRWLTRHAVAVTIASAVLFAALSALHWSATRFVVMSDFYDLGVYRAGGQALVDDVRLYAGGLNGGSASFTYPPFAAALFVPLTWGPLAGWQAAVFPVGLAALAGSVHLSLRAAGATERRGTGAATLALTALFLWLEPVSWTLYLGQINLLLMLVVLGDLVGTRPGSPLRGIGVGVAAGIKLTPAIFIVHLLLTRQFRAAATAAVTALATVGLSLLVAYRDTVDYWSGTFLETDRVGVVASQMNQSLNGMLARLTGTAEPPRVLWLALVAIAVAIGLGTAVVAHRRGKVLLGVTLTGLTGAAVSPISWSHHWVWFVPLGVIALHAAPARLRPGRAAAVAAVVLLTFAWPAHFLTGHRMDAAPLGIIALPSWHGVDVLYGNAYLVLFAGVLVWAVRHLLAPGTTGAAEPLADRDEAPAR